MLFSAYAAPPFQKSIFQKNYSMHKKKSQAAGGGSPPTLRPNFNCKKGSVTAAAAACMPLRGIFVDKNLQGKKASPERGDSPRGGEMPAGQRGPLSTRGTAVRRWRGSYVTLNVKQKILHKWKILCIIFG
jgi:hypothetical protein